MLTFLIVSNILLILLENEVSFMPLLEVVNQPLEEKKMIFADD